jgi:hypothetical protein
MHFQRASKTSSATSAQNSKPPRPKLPSPPVHALSIHWLKTASEPQNRQITFHLITDIGNSKQPGSWLMSWIMPRFVELSPPAKTRKCAETKQSKGRTWDTNMLREDPGWSLLELISRRPGRRRNEEGKATRALIGDASCCRHSWRPSRSAGITFPRAHVLFPT